MVAEPWILKLGNQMSSNLKHALSLENSTNKKQGSNESQTIGILSFEVANLFSKIIHLHKSLTENAFSKLKKEILNSEGIKILISSNEHHLLELAFEEKLDDLNRVARMVSRFGKKCTIPALQGFEHVYGDIVSGRIDVRELGFLVKDMNSMVRKMERYASSTASLYAEMEVMNELEATVKKFHQNEESRKVFEQKLMWQKQDIRHLKNVSLWNQKFDKVVEILVRCVCTVYGRLFVVFEDVLNRHPLASGSQVGFRGCVKLNFPPKSHQFDVADGLTCGVNKSSFRSGQSVREGLSKKTELKNEGSPFRPGDFKLVCGTGPGRLFMECLSLSSKVDDDDRISSYNDDQSSEISTCFSSTNTSIKFDPKSRLLAHASSNTIGGSALALHYANIILILEKLLRYPHLVGDEIRDDLYQMLPTSLRKTLKTSMKSYARDLAMAIYDGPLAHAWREQIDLILAWLAPLAHNMIRWQSERNFEQHQIVTRTNVLLLQTLYFADREKMEAAICKVLIGLDYICRYEQQQNTLLDCGSSFNLEDCIEWHSQFRASFRA